MLHRDRELTGNVFVSQLLEVSHLHNAIPVVAGGYPKQRKKRCSWILKVSMHSHAFARGSRGAL